MAISLGMAPGQLPGADAAVSEDDALELDPGSVVLVDLPELVVNLNVTGTRLRFLKFAATLEVGSEEEALLVVGAAHRRQRARKPPPCRSRSSVRRMPSTG